MWCRMERQEIVDAETLCWRVPGSNCGGIDRRQFGSGLFFSLIGLGWENRKRCEVGTRPGKR